MDQTNPTPEQIAPDPAKQAKIEDNLRKQREHYERIVAEKQAEIERLSSRGRPQGDDEDEDDEPYVDSRKLKKKLSAFEKDLDQKIEQKAEMKARALLDEQNRNSYLRENGDFNQVMSSDLVQKFADTHPRLAENILRMPEGFERQKLVYENIKALGIDRPQPKQQSIQEKIEANRRSPYYQPSGVGSTPYAPQGDFSSSGQKAAYDKLQELKRNLRI